MAKSYAQMLKKQLKPRTTSFLSKLFENFEEKLKNPNSVEFKTMSALIVLIAGRQLAEKIIAQTLAFIHYAEKQLGKSPRRHSGGPVEISGEHTGEQQEIDEHSRLNVMRTLLTEATSRLDFLDAQRKQLIEGYKAQLQNLKNIYEPQMKQAIEENLKIPASDNQLNEINTLYQERAEKRPEIIAKAKKVGATPELFAAEDPASHARINANLDMGTQIILANLLKEASQVINPTSTPIPMRNLLQAVNNVHSVANLYQQIISTVKEDHQKALADMQNAESPLRQLVSALSQELNISPTPSRSTAVSSKQHEEEDVKSTTPSPFSTTLKGH